jgi:hypothetical protein
MLWDRLLATNRAGHHKERYPSFPSVLLLHESCKALKLTGEKLNNGIFPHCLCFALSLDSIFGADQWAVLEFILAWREDGDGVASSMRSKLFLRSLYTFPSQSNPKT